LGGRSGKAAVADCLADTNKRASEVKIACFGLAFKPNIDDLRESPAMGIAQSIAHWHKRRNIGGGTEYPSTAEKTGRSVPTGNAGRCPGSADVLVLLVDHNEFKAIKGDAVHQQYVVDTKGSGGENPRQY
jgi:UDP-N-acetyl-D-mannosaminuronic acid dehydrogenase